MPNRKKIQLTQEQIERGMKAIKSWYKTYSEEEKDEYVIVSGAKEDCWTPRKIMKILENREKTGKWGEGDIPEMILESISQKNDIKLA